MLILEQLVDDLERLTLGHGEKIAADRRQRQEFLALILWQWLAEPYERWEQDSAYFLTLTNARQS